MAENKTHVTAVDPATYLAALTPARRASEGQALLELFMRATGVPGRMWGPSMVGFGELRYRYASGREGVSMRVGFAARSTGPVLYGLREHAHSAALLARLGPHRESAGCVYLRRLGDCDLDVLSELCARSFAARTEFEIDPG